MSAWLSDTATLFRREVLRYRRDRAYWIGQIVFPVAVVGLIGSGLNGVISLPSRAGYPAHLATGMLVLLVGSGAVGAGFTLMEDRERGFLRALLVAPVSRASLVLGKLAARWAASLLLVGMLVAVLSAGIRFPVLHVGALLIAVSGVTAVFVALGVGLAARLRRMESFRMIAAFVTVPLYLFSGIFYPVSTLPLPMRALAYANPLTYAVDLFRYGLLDVHELPLAASVPLLVGLTVLATWLAVRFFERSTRG
jgi:ABC-2 type transport system permease protein